MQIQISFIGNLLFSQHKVSCFTAEPSVFPYLLSKSYLFSMFSKSPHGAPPTKIQTFNFTPNGTCSSKLDFLKEMTYLFISRKELQESFVEKACFVGKGFKVIQKEKNQTAPGCPPLFPSSVSRQPAELQGNSPGPKLILALKWYTQASIHFLLLLPVDSFFLLHP